MRNLILKWRNRFIAICFDIGMIPIAWFGAYWLRFNLQRIPAEVLERATYWFLPIILIQVFIFWFFGLYRGVWRFASIPDLIRITKAVATGMIGLLIAFVLLQTQLGMPRVVPILYGILLGGGLASARALFRWLKDYRHLFRNSKRVLIVGAGNAGEGLVRDLLRDNGHLYQPIALVDDSAAKLGRDIHGVPVVGKCNKIPKIVSEYNIDLIFIAVPSASSAEMRRVVNYCEQTKLPFRTLPGISDLAKGRVDIHLLRDVALGDLLGRDQVQLDWQSVEKDLQNKCVLVSGGGGSIGSELCRQIALLCPQKLIVIDNCEFNLYAIDMELRKKFPHLIFQSILLNITDIIGVKKIFTTFQPEVVFHAAAYKHVPLLENQERVAIHNNVIGTHILASLAAEYHVNKFILISTDKAVNPANLMGATKRAAELICQSLQDSTHTAFITVRFGNVLDSAGSVVPLFRKQIQEGGPLTVTHPEITRYFMSIPEASQLILQAAQLGEGGEIFVLDMGEPVKIRYLAEQMIKLAGKILKQDIDIVYTGLRPGEKLSEELFYDTEKLQPTTHHKIMLGNANKVDVTLLNDIIKKMKDAYLQGDEKLLHAFIRQLVPEYINQTMQTENIISIKNQTTHSFETDLSLVADLNANPASL